MRNGKQIFYLLAALVLLLILAVQHDQPAAAQGQNILQNPGFEQPYNSDGAAGNWVRWHRESAPELFDDCTNGYHKRPRWGAATDFVQSGSTSQFVGNNWDTWAGGVWQTVNVNQGARYRFTFYARGYGAMDADEASFQGLQMNIRAGIDPNGSGLWNDSDVVWSAPGNAHDTWVPFSIEAVATGSQMTVFTQADWGVEGVNQCYQFLNTYFDSAELVELGPPPTNTPPPPPPPTNTPPPPTATPTPENSPTPTITPTPTATATATPIPGAVVCVNAFADMNGNGARDADEGFMAGVTFSVSSATEVVGEGVSPGNETGVCFEGLPTGTYQVDQRVPSRLEMTTAGTAELPVEEGRTYSVEFGSRLATDSDDEPTPVAVADVDAPAAGETEDTAVPDASSTSVGVSGGTLLGLGVAILGVILLGGLLFVALRRA